MTEFKYLQEDSSLEKARKVFDKSYMDSLISLGASNMNKEGFLFGMDAPLQRMVEDPSVLMQYFDPSFLLDQFSTVQKMRFRTITVDKVNVKVKNFASKLYGVHIPAAFIFARTKEDFLKARSLASKYPDVVFIYSNKYSYLREDMLADLFYHIKAFTASRKADLNQVRVYLMDIVLKKYKDEFQNSPFCILFKGIVSGEPNWNGVLEYLKVCTEKVFPLNFDYFTSIKAFSIPIIRKDVFQNTYTFNPTVPIYKKWFSETKVTPKFYIDYPHSKLTELKKHIADFLKERRTIREILQEVQKPPYGMLMNTGTLAIISVCLSSLLKDYRMSCRLITTQVDPILLDMIFSEHADHLLQENDGGEGRRLRHTDFLFKYDRDEERALKLLRAMFHTEQEDVLRLRTEITQYIVKDVKLHPYLLAKGRSENVVQFFRILYEFMRAWDAEFVKHGSGANVVESVCSKTLSTLKELGSLLNGDSNLKLQIKRVFAQKDKLYKKYEYKIQGEHLPEYWCMLDDWKRVENLFSTDSVIWDEEKWDKIKNYRVPGEKLKQWRDHYISDILAPVHMEESKRVNNYAREVLESIYGKGNTDYHECFERNGLFMEDGINYFFLTDEYKEWHIQEKEHNDILRYINTLVAEKKIDPKTDAVRMQTEEWNRIKEERRSLIEKYKKENLQIVLWKEFNNPFEYSPESL